MSAGLMVELDDFKSLCHVNHFMILNLGQESYSYHLQTPFSLNLYLEVFNSILITVSQVHSLCLLTGVEVSWSLLPLL